MDSSGIEFQIFYTSEPREHEAGILNLGYTISRDLIIPPNTQRYDVIGYCDPQCTSRVSGLARQERDSQLGYISIVLQYIPSDGIIAG